MRRVLFHDDIVGGGEFRKGVAALVCYAGAPDHRAAIRRNRAAYYGWLGYAYINPATFRRQRRGLTKGIIGLGQQRAAAQTGRLGALRAWAWARRAASIIWKTEKAMDAKHVGIEGVSGYASGPSDDGVRHALRPRFDRLLREGGAKLHRRNFGERSRPDRRGRIPLDGSNFLKYGVGTKLAAKRSDRPLTRMS